MQQDEWLAPLIAKYEEAKAARIDYENRLIPISHGHLAERPDAILATPETLAEFERLRESTITPEEDKFLPDFGIDPWTEDVF